MDRRAFFGVAVGSAALLALGTRPSQASPAALPRLSPLLSPDGSAAVATEADLAEARIEDVRWHRRRRVCTVYRSRPPRRVCRWVRY